MGMEELYIKLNERLEEMFPGRLFNINKPKFENDLKNEYQQDLKNITLPMVVVEKILLEPVTLKDYADANGVSYSSIQQNKERYSSLTLQGRNYFVAKYELLHSKRLNENYGNRTEYEIQRNPKLLDQLMRDSYDQDKAIESVILNILKDHYGI